MCIYIDYDNLYWSSKQYRIDVTSDKYNICELFYMLYGNDRIKDYHVYADFDKLNINLRTIQIQRARIVNVFGKNRYDKSRKNSLDIELCIDITENLYKNKNIDTYVIATSDTDVISIINKLKYHGKRVHLYYMKIFTSHNTPIDIYIVILPAI